MVLFSWSPPHFVTSPVEIDDHHLRLMGLTNRVGDLLASRSALDPLELDQAFDELVAFTEYHFTTEQALMDQVGVDLRHSGPHKEEHASFLQDVVQMRDNLKSSDMDRARNLCQFLAHWLVYHILGTDQAMSRQIAAIQEGKSPAEAFEGQKEAINHSTATLLDALHSLYGILFERNRQLSGLNQSLEEQRTNLVAELAHSRKMESLGTLAGGVAHDMNNVLGAILGLASLQEAQAADGSALKISMETITTACHRGATLVKGLLDFARQGLAEEKILDLNTLVQEEVALLERTTLQRVRLEIDLAKDLLPIKGDPGALSHALLNLCVNAVDATSEGGTLTLITRNGPDGLVFLEVADTGIGMSREVLDRATDPFFTTKPPGMGTGLGLSIVYGTMKAHGGTVEIQSEPGKGTRVTLRFPSCKSSTQDTESDPESGEVPKQRTLHVLLVDDDELIQGSVPELLRSMGHITTSATSGEEALAKLQGGLSPDVVLLDMNMPGLGGSRTLSHLRAFLPTVPVFLATGRVDQVALALIDSYKHVTLLAKPFGLKELQKQLESLPSPSWRE
jgi:hemerythrin-like metal-binding protein